MYTKKIFTLVLFIASSLTWSGISTANTYDCTVTNGPVVTVPGTNKLTTTATLSGDECIEDIEFSIPNIPASGYWSKAETEYEYADCLYQEGANEVGVDSELPAIGNQSTDAITFIHTENFAGTQRTGTLDVYYEPQFKDDDRCGEFELTVKATYTLECDL